LFDRNGQWSRVSGTSDDAAVRAYATTKAKGTGLGLAIVKKIVEEHTAKSKSKISNRAVRHPHCIAHFCVAGENT